MVVLPAFTSASRSVIVLPTTSYGELVTGGGSATPETVPVTGSPWIAGQLAGVKPGTEIVARFQLAIVQIWPVSRSLSGGVAARVVAVFWTAVTCVPTAGIGGPVGGLRDSDSPMTT